MARHEPDVEEMRTAGDSFAAAIERLAKSQGASVTGWRAPLPLLFATVMTALAFFPFLALIQKLADGRPRPPRP